MISVAGVGIGAFALIVVLSVFNGFEKVIGKMVDATTPDLLVTPKTGKWIDLNTFPLTSLQNVEGVKAVVEVIEEDVLFRYNDKQHIGRIKGVAKSFEDLQNYLNKVLQLLKVLDIYLSFVVLFQGVLPLISYFHPENST